MVSSGTFPPAPSFFSTRVLAKWVLAGEHSVLRGAMAVALPHPDFYLELRMSAGQCTHGDSNFNIQPEESHSVILMLFQQALVWLKHKGFYWRFPKGEYSLKSTIPIGAGLGSSAVLCVAVVRLIKWMGVDLTEPDELSLARELEHTFHGQSSGMDIAVVHAGKPICFTRENGAKVLELKRIPRFTFHDTGLRSQTRDCVARVLALQDKDKSKALHLDQLMGEASQRAAEGLAQYSSDPQKGLPLLIEAMNQARDAFRGWGLCNSSIEKFENELLKKGALAVKMTGSGAGGFIVALWD